MATLRRQQTQGHTYAPLRTLLDAAQTHPLFYRSQIALNEQHFLSKGNRNIVESGSFIDETDGQRFFYLRETKQAEEIVGRFIEQLISKNRTTPTSDGSIDRSMGTHRNG